MSRQAHAPRTSWLVLIAIVLLPMALYWPFVFGGKTVFWGTPLLQFWPWRRFAAEQLASGQLPLWNPYSGNGVPLLADHQTAVLYPLNLIFWVVPVERAMGLSLVLHAILAGGAMYALSREFGVSRVGALVSALAFMFSGYAVARGSFLTEISALAWLPLIWLCGERLVRRRSGSDLACLAAVVGLQFLAGHAQTWFYSLCAVGLYGLWRIVDLGGSQTADHRFRVARGMLRAAHRCFLLLVAVVWGVALAAAQFLPTLELSYLSGRAHRAGWETFALQYSFWPWRLITLLLPDFFGNPASGDYWGYATYWEDAGYIGVLPFLFALLALVAWVRWRRRDAAGGSPLRAVPFFAALALFALLMAMGKNTPLYLLFFRHVPGVRSFQAPARWLSVYTGAMALLAGVGADALRSSRRLAFACRLGVAGGAAVALTTLGARELLPGVKATFFDPLIQFAAWFAAAMLLFLWGQVVRQGEALRFGRLRLGYTVWAVATIVVTAVDLVYAGHDLNPGADASLYAPQTRIGAFLAADGPRGRTFYPAGGREEVMFGHYLDFGDYGPSKRGYWWGMRESLLPDLGVVEHLSSANSFEPLIEGQSYALIQMVDRLLQSEDAEVRQIALRALGLMNVAYILDPTAGADADPVYRSPSVNVYRNPYVLPRAYTVCQVRAAGSPEEALRTLALPGFDPTQEVILERLPASVLASGETDREAIPCDLQPAAFLLSAPNQVTIRAVLPQPGYLVLADTFYPGWQAFVGGQRSEILRANAAFRAVPLAAGEHEVVFRYQPASLAAGVACSTVALIGLLVVCLGALIRARRHEAEILVQERQYVREFDLKPIVIVPTYNEAENIRLLAADISALPIPMDVVIVDDNSPDGTGQIADELVARNPRVHVIHREGKLGLGTAYIAGFKYALERDYDRILTMDADFSHHPRYIPDVVEKSRTEFDLVIGSRYVKGGGTYGCALPRKVLSWGANAFAKVVLGLQAMDCTAGFRCYRRQVLESIDLDAILANGYSFLIEMLYGCQRQGWRVGEVPIVFENRRRGASKISQQEVKKAMYTVLRLGKERLLSLGKRETMAERSEVL